MKISYMSDLHLEFGPLKQELLGGDILILAGDICLWERLDNKHTDKISKQHRETVTNFLTAALTKYTEILYIPGNHEFYGGDLQTALSKFHTFSKTISPDTLKVFHPYGQHRIGTDLVFIFATLWTDFGGSNVHNMYCAKRFMSDYHQIKNHDMNLTPDTILLAHHEAKAYIETALQTNNGRKKIVVTHHSPHPMSTHSRYRDDY